MSAPRRLRPELGGFLTVGAAGYVVDVAVFNALRTPSTVLAELDPAYARVGAVAVAMLVTYAGNRLITWRGGSRHQRRREVGLFVLFNLVGLAFSVAALLVSHDLLGLTSRWADNVSANGVGLAIGTAFRFWSYRTFVFTTGPRPPAPAQPCGDTRPAARPRT